MKRIFISTLLIILSVTFGYSKQKNSQKKIIQSWLKTDALTLQLPAFYRTKDVSGNIFDRKNLLQENPIAIDQINAEEGTKLKWDGKESQWNKVVCNKKGFYQLPDQENQFYYFVSYLNTEQWTQFKLNLQTYPLVEVYVDGKKQISNYLHQDKKIADLSTDLKLEQGHHSIVVKVLTGAKNNRFKLSIQPTSNWKKEDFQFTLSQKQFMDIHKVLDGKKVKNIQLSFDGKLALISYSRTLAPSDKTENWKEIQNLENGEIIYSFRGSQLSNIQWLPNNNQISYTKNYNGKTSIFVFDFEKGKEKTIAENLTDFSAYTWAPTGEYIIYSTSKDYASDWKLRKFQGMEDRLPWFRMRSFLYKLDVESKVRQRLTYGHVSTNLADIRKDGQKILFTQSRPDYDEYPYFKQNLYEMDVQSFAIDTIWKDKLFDGAAQYSPNGTMLLVQGGPSCFGKLGENIGNNPIANNYDGQLYIYHLNDANKTEAITYQFNPSVGQAVWNAKDNKIYIKAEDQDYVRLFSYEPNSKKFETIDTQADVVKAFNISSNGNKIAYTACSISSPYKAYVINNNTAKIVSNPEKNHLADVQFGKTEDWNFTKADGTKIIGRVYYPPNFDASKKYPLIVNYYGGTSPVERSFGGRYPLNMYAAMGYVVYLLQPSGATGFGQEFAARHQNNWGIVTADEIIEGTKQFIKEHSFINANKVGCIGASYGGFTTQLLQTKTDLFAAAISHAGISDITSYWGEGYWGYSYSVNATGKSFPWNRKDIYVEQSPLFNADKITTPMLLLHGSVDTNVPLGESIQMYQALKLLGKEVDFIQVKDQNHLIQNYNKRILWNNTIFAYFAKWLKDQPQWWNELYPDKNL